MSNPTSRMDKSSIFRACTRKSSANKTPSRAREAATQRRSKQPAPGKRSATLKEKAINPSAFGHAVLWVTGVLFITGCSHFEYEQGPGNPTPPAWISDKPKAGDDLQEQITTATQRLEAHRRGKKLYRHACATCHGLRGGGKGPSAQPLDPRPRDFTTGKFVMGDSALDIFESIAFGVPGSQMSAWKDLLSEEDIWALVAHIKSLSSSRGKTAWLQNEKASKSSGAR